MTSRLLLVSTCRWFGPARMASSFLGLGSHVEAVCGAGHAIRAVRGMGPVHPWRPLMPVRSLETAIRSARPDFIISCDDVATSNLHRVYERAVQSSALELCGLLERSLGDPRHFPIATSRTDLMAVARDHGFRTPDNAFIDSEETLRNWVNEHGFPSVLKADHTFGGRGIRLLSVPSDVSVAWRALSSHPSRIRALKRVLINGDSNDVLPAMLKSRNAISVQRFIRGQDANATVACLNGKTLACFTATVSKTGTPFGPATVLKIVDHPEVSRVVSTIVGALRLSGLIGFDFVIEQGSCETFLIEMNPRATQLCHLALGGDRDLMAALLAAHSNTPYVPRPRVTDNDVIALFPQEMRRDPSSEYISAAYHDVPWDEPELIKASIETNWRLRLWERISTAREAQLRL